MDIRKHIPDSTHLNLNLWNQFTYLLETPSLQRAARPPSLGSFKSPNRMVRRAPDGTILT
jgi:hypothetical protein